MFDLLKNKQNILNLDNKEYVQKLIKGCLNKNLKSQEKIFKLTYPKVMGTLVRYTKDEKSAQIILGDAWIKIFRIIGTFKEDDNFIKWVLNIVINTAIDSFDINEKMFEVNLPHVKAVDFDNISSIGKLPVETLLGEINKLGIAQNLVFNMYVFEEMSHSDISKRLNISIETSKLNLSQAKCALRNSVAELV